MMKTWAWAATGIDKDGKAIERRGTAFTFEGAFTDLERLENDGVLLTRTMVARVLPGELRLDPIARA